MPAVHRRPPRLLIKQFFVWLAWFVLSGYVFHNRTAADLKNVSVPEAMLRLASLGVVLVAAYWIFAVMPADIRGLIAAGALVGVSLGAVPFFVQVSVTKYLEFRQIWP